MAAIKPLERASRKWVSRASIAGPEYTFGIQNPRNPWQEQALAAEDVYKTSVTAAANAGRYGRGVRRAGNDKWQDRSIKKGPGRFAEGVAVAQPDWEAGFSPFHAAFSALTLPKRGPRNSPANYQRSQLVGQTFARVREQMGTR